MTAPDPPLDVGADFPAARLRTYLNSASVALMPSDASTAIAAWHHDLALNGTHNFDEVAEDRVFDELRGGFAELIGATAGDIAVASCATELIASLAWSVMPEAGRSIVTTEVVFPTTAYPWARVARHTGATVRFVPATNGVIDEDELVAAIDDTTAVVAICHVEFASGQRYDLTRIAAAARRVGAFLMVDASQSVGAIPVSIQSEPVDALVTTSYKWLCGPFGVGLMYLDPRWHPRLDPGIVGWRTHAEIYDLRADRCVPRDDARRFEFGTMSYGSAVGLERSIRYLSGVGVDRIFRSNVARAERLASGLRRAGAVVIESPKRQRDTSIVTARFPSQQSGEVVRALGALDVEVSARQGFVRFSPHLYNTDADIDRALGGIAQLRD